MARLTDDDRRRLALAELVHAAGRVLERLVDVLDASAHRLEWYAVRLNELAATIRRRTFDP